MQEYEFSIVPWISWKTYFVNDTQITIIFEQRTECYYLLYNTLSVCWNDINNKTSICLSEIQNLSLLISDGVINLNLSEIQYDIRCNSIIKTKELPEYILNNIKIKGYIFDVHWDLTNRCNAKCVHCYNSHAHDGTRNNSRDELSFNEAIKLVDNLDYLGVFRIVLSGGEASTKEYFLELCDYIRKKHINLIIYSNGLLLNTTTIRKLSNIYPYSVCISAYGPNSVIHEAITQVKGSYIKVLSCLKELKRCQIHTCHKNTLLSLNYKYWHETYQKGCLISDNSMINLTIYPSMDNGKLTQYSLDEEQLLELALTEGSPIDYRTNKIGACNIHKDKDESPCYDVTNQLYISPRGYIYPCIAAPYKIADFRKGTLEELRYYKKNNDFVFSTNNMTCCEKLNNWRSLKISDLKECGKYDYCNFCIDVCPGDAYLMHGDYLVAPLNHCSIAIARYKAFVLNL